MYGIWNQGFKHRFQTVKYYVLWIDMGFASLYPSYELFLKSEGYHYYLSKICTYLYTKRK